MYKLVISDYKIDKTFEYLSGAYEMSGLCCALLSKPAPNNESSWMNLKSNNNNINTNSNAPTNMNNNTLSSYSSSKREMENYFNLAFHTYISCNDSRRATRSSMWYWLSYLTLGYAIIFLNGKVRDEMILVRFVVFYFQAKGIGT